MPVQHEVSSVVTPGDVIRMPVKQAQPNVVHMPVVTAAPIPSTAGLGVPEPYRPGVTPEEDAAWQDMLAKRGYMEVTDVHGTRIIRNPYANNQPPISTHPIVSTAAGLQRQLGVDPVTAVALTKMLYSPTINHPVMQAAVQAPIPGLPAPTGPATR